MLIAAVIMEETAAFSHEKACVCPPLRCSLSRGGQSTERLTQVHVRGLAMVLGDRSGVVGVFKISLF